MFLSTNGGASWAPTNNELSGAHVYSLTVSGTSVFASTMETPFVFSTTDSGNSWTAIGIAQTQFGVPALIANGGVLFAGTFGGGVFLSTNNGKDWTQASTGLTDLGIQSLTVSSGSIVAGTYGEGAFLSSDNGNSWGTSDNGFTLPFTYVNSLVISGTNLLAATLNGIFLSTDNGAHWNLVGSDLISGSVPSLAISNGNLFACSNTDHIYRSTDNGQSWTAASSGFVNPPGSEIISSVACLASSRSGLLAGSTGRGVFLSTDSGASWNAVNTGLTGGYVTALVANDSSVLAGSWGVFLSTDGGVHWNAADSGLPSPYPGINCFEFFGSNVFAGTDGGGIFLSTDRGLSWAAVNMGLEGARVLSIAVSGKDLLAGTESGLWKRPLSEMITAVETRSNPIPSAFSLMQNYPNPFNPSTIISYHLATNANVVLRIFDVLGRQVGTLVNERQRAGDHSVKFDGGALPSGVYFYKLETGVYHDTKKLLMLK